MMQIFSRPVNQPRILRVLIAAGIAQAMCSGLIFTGGVAKNVAIVRAEVKKEQQQSKKVDDRLIAANTKFSFKLYEQALKHRRNQNVFVSPASIMLALAMTYNGAEGETRRAMADALGLESMSLEDVNRAAAALTSVVGSTDSKVQVRIANSLWAKQGFVPKPAFLQRSKEFYKADVTSLDFANPMVTETINSWVSKHTEGTIKKIVDQIDNDVILFLVNAIYFKGEWQVSFDKEKTKDDMFRLADGRRKKLPMMFQSGNYLYQKGNDFQAIVLPYGTGSRSMYVVLPDENTSLDDFERNLTAENWEIWMKSFGLAPGELTLPRFRIEYAADLKEMLKALGMAEAFNPAKADFSGIAEPPPGQRIYLSRVMHKAFAEVNEDGTEAAAVTSVTASLTSVSVPPKNFVMRVDRPFFFAIRDNSTGTLLFIGSVMDPA